MREIVRERVRVRNRVDPVTMPIRLETPLLSIDAGKMHKVDTRNVENLFGMWTGEWSLHSPRRKRKPLADVGPRSGKQSSPSVQSPWKTAND